MVAPIHEFAPRVATEPVTTPHQCNVAAAAAPSPAALRDTLAGPEGAARRGGAPQPNRLLSPQDAGEAAKRQPGLEALLKIYRLLCDEPHASQADVAFHHWLSYSSLAPNEISAEPKAVLALMESTAAELSASMVRGRRMNEVVRYPCAPRRLTGADLPSDAVRPLLDSHHCRMVKARDDAHSGFSAVLVAALYALYTDPDRLVAGLLRAVHQVPAEGLDSLLDDGRRQLTLLAEHVRAGHPLESLLHGLRVAPTAMEAIVAALRGFAATLQVPDYLEQPDRPLAAEHVEPLAQALFGLDATVVDSERALNHYANSPREHALGTADTLYLLRTGEHLDALITAKQAALEESPRGFAPR